MPPVFGHGLDFGDGREFRPGHVPADLLGRYFRRCGGSYVVAPEVRSEVLFRKFNLTTAPYPFKKPFHVIFCRNVLIYFDAPTRRRVSEALYKYTIPGGYLFVGHAESLLGLTEKFHMVHKDSGTAYQRIEVRE